MKYKSGDVMLSNWSNGIYAKLIRLHNRITYGKNSEPWTHAGIITACKKDRVLVHEAVAKGFVSSWYWIEHIEKDVKAGKVLIGRPKKHVRYVRAIADSKDFKGRGYAWQDIISIALTAFLKIPMSWTGAKRLICSEAVARVLYDASQKQIILGYDKKKENQESEFNKPYDQITPVDLRYSEQIEWKIKN